MSDTTDDMEAQAGLYEAHLENQQRLVDRKEWQTRDGQVMKISAMEDSHLLNTINLLRRSAQTWRERTVAAGYQTLAMVQGEQATWDIEQDIDRLESATIDEVADIMTPHFENLIVEAERRKLL